MLNDTEKQKAALEEVLAYHEALRRLRFTPDEIFLFIHDSEPKVGVALQAEGKELVVICGDRFVEVPEVKRLWRETTERWNREAGRETKWVQGVWEESLAQKNSLQLLTMLSAVGLGKVYQKRIEAEEARARVQMDKAKQFKN